MIYFISAVEEQLAEQDESDIYLLSRIADIIHSLFLTNKTGFLQYFEQVVHHFTKLLDPTRPSWADRQWGLCIFDDLIGEIQIFAIIFTFYLLI